MKRFLVIIGAALMAISISTASIAAGIGIGLTGNYTTLDTSGTETQRQTGTVASGSISEDVALPEFFVEFVELANPSKPISSNSSAGDAMVGIFICVSLSIFISMWFLSFHPL